jgi:lysyl-tRNA synthetase class 2
MISKDIITWEFLQLNLFPEGFRPSLMLEQITNVFNLYNKDNCEDFLLKNIDDTNYMNYINNENTSDIKISGRIVFKRDMGSICFFKVYNIESKAQIFLSKNTIGDELFRFFCNNLSLGDTIGVTGFLFKTKAGEVTLHVEKLLLLCKSIGLTSKWHGIQDQDIILEKPYLSIIANEDKRILMIKRPLVIKAIKKILEKYDFLEVETPILQPVPSGASAAPFKTYYNSLKQDFYLRIAPENYLKQMMVAGFNRIYEIGKNFRNEGIDRTHLQEFTMLECYSAFWTYKDYVPFVKELILSSLDILQGKYEVMINEEMVDFKDEWKEIKFSDWFMEKTGLDVFLSTESHLLQYAKKEKLINEGQVIDNKYNLVDLIYKKKCCLTQNKPLIVTNYPIFYCPLAKHDINGKELLMFQLVIGGLELVKAYSELIDYKIQEDNFLEQEKNNQKNTDGEYFRADWGLVNALKYGASPMAGFGFGIDRCLLLFSNQQNIRDVVFFTHHKSESI